MNFFIGAFYDGVYLLGIALNETLTEGGDIRDGISITRRMWDRDFIGITGHVRIDDNGDRDADYSILDLDPITGRSASIKLAIPLIYLIMLIKPHSTGLFWVYSFLWNQYRSTLNSKQNFDIIRYYVMDSHRNNINTRFQVWGGGALFRSKSWI